MRTLNFMMTCFRPPNLILWLLSIISPCLLAATGRAILTSLPELPAQGPTAAQCKVLQDAAVAYRAQAESVGKPLLAQLEKAAQDLQKKMASGTMPRDELMQSMLIGQLAQDKKASDTQGLCYGPITWPVAALDEKFAKDSNAAEAVRRKAIDACPLVRGGEGNYPDPACVNVANASHRAAQGKLNDAYLRQSRDGYLVRQTQLQQCVAQAGDIDASHLAQISGAWRAAVDPANETVHAANLAEFLTSNVATICSRALERLPKP